MNCGIFLWGYLMSIRKIVAFTGIRSDYDLLSTLYREINKSEAYEIKLIVSGAHLVQEMGYSFNEILEDGIPILGVVESLLNTNNLTGRAKSLGILVQEATNLVSFYLPDLIIVAGDREEVLAATIIGAYLEIPVAHFFGGDHTIEGHVDNPIRHATSKLANIHFVSNEISKQRLISMGEEEFRIFNVGSPALDKFKREPKTSFAHIMERLNLTIKVKEYAILIYHPELGESDNSIQNFTDIISALRQEEIFTFVSYPNSDGGYLEIVKEIDKLENDPNFYVYKNLDRNTFVNLFRESMFLIGNSSMGLYESSINEKYAINVGKRQMGRLASKNVRFVKSGRINIVREIKYIKNQLKIKNFEGDKFIYGAGETVKDVMKVLNNMDFSKYKYKKEDSLK